MKKLSIFAILIILTQAAPASALPGDEHWSDDFFRLAIAGEVKAVAEYDGLLVLGGRISTAADLSVDNIATWDGLQWGTLGDGVNGDILVLAEYDGCLIAAGEFSEAGGAAAANIARWNGESWQPLGEGADGSITELCHYDGGLVALGDFTSLLGAAGAKLAFWDGSAWSALGIGPDFAGLGRLYAATVHEGNLVVGGRAESGPSGGPFVWDGFAWSAPVPYPGNLPGGTGYPDFGHISVLAEYEGKLVAGGHFTGLDPGSGDYWSAICQWDGTRWIGLGEILSAPSPIMTNDVDILCLQEYEGDLIVGGFFFEGPLDADPYGIVRYDGTDWQSMGGGLVSGDPWNGEFGIVNDLGLWNDQLVAGGMFERAGIDAQREVRNVALWQADQWQPLGPEGLGLDGSVLASLIYEGDLVVGGSWVKSDGEVQHLARLGDEGWDLLGGDPDDLVQAMILFDGALVIAGEFTEVGGVPAQHVAAYDGGAWQPLGDGVPFVQNALGVYDGQLWAGKYRWDGSIWTNELMTAGTVHDLQVWNGDLYAGGDFGSAAGIEANGIVGWDGSECFPVGAGLTDLSGTYNMAAYDLDVYGGVLVAGGEFYRAGEVAARHIASWDGQTWSDFAPGLNSGNSFYGVYALTVHGNQLFAGGRFVHESLEVNKISRWNGVQWHVLGSGIAGYNVHALLVHDDALWVGGDFSTAGDRPAFAISSWNNPAIFDPSSHIDPQIPDIVTRLQVHPNPFNPRVMIAFDLARAGTIDLAVYDLSGRRVRELAVEFMPAGRNEVYWNGVDGRGRAMPSGQYFVRLVSASGVATQKVLLVR